MAEDFAQTELGEFEHEKKASNFLRGNIKESLADPTTWAISEEDTKLLKFHGAYQQDDRDLRDARRKQKLEPAYQFFIRTRLPGGVMQPYQWLALDEVAREHGRGTFKITTRQTFQIHGITKPHLKQAFADMNTKADIDTIAACGDVNRNTICSTNPHLSAIHKQVYEISQDVAAHMLPKGDSYYELWLDKPAPKTDNPEPFYGPYYLPRKFKIAIAVPPVNDVDCFANEIGFIAIIENDELKGFNVAVGGGMGNSYGDDRTYPRAGSVIGFIPTDEIKETSMAVALVQHKYGDRYDRMQARMKYTIDLNGIDWFTNEVEERLGHKLEAAKPYHFDHNGDRYGWIEGEDGLWHLTLYIEAGRLYEPREMDGMRAIAQAHKGEFRLTTNQNVIIARVAPEDREVIDKLVEEYKLDDYKRTSQLRQHAMACVAFPTCGLAMAESERYLPTILSKLEDLLDKHGILHLPITFRMSGCPNGCSRPYLAEIALTGKAIGRYNLDLGGNFAGERVNKVYLQNVTEPEILDALDPLFESYAKEREEGEHFGDFLFRTGALENAVDHTQS